MSKLLQELSDVSNIANITEVKFGLLNPEALKKASVCHVTIPETYDGNEPKENGLFDPRMGVLERGRICPTDDYDHTICPGYFGHIELPLPVYWIQHMDTIIKLLRCVCIRCANLLVDKSNPIIMKELKKKNGANAFKYVADLCTKQSSKKCIYNGGCNAVQPTIYRKVMGDKYKNDNIIQIDAEYSSDAFKDANEKKLKFMLPVEHVLNIFKKITNEDAELLGFDILDSRPEWMICTVVPVAPPAVRPSVRQDNNQRAEDDLTSKIAEIVKNVNLLKKELEKALKKDSDVEKESSARQINLVHNMIQYHVATMVDNEIKNIPVSSRRSGQPLKMIRQRLKGKEGRIRSNIMGKRVDFSGRTVVGVDPSISIDEYGVPMKIAMNLTVPEIVTKYNKDKLYRLVRNGPLVHPGAKQITKMNYDENGIAHPEHIYLKYIDRNSVVLEDGDVIDRHLMDGDWGQFNRQPSLHRMSMMAHKVKVMPGKTFRLNVYCTAPYNADFDGDEMNTHIPQNIQTAYELEKLTAVPTQIISPAKSEPIIQVNFDTMVAAFLITHPHIKITRKNAFNLTMTNNQFTGKMPSPDKDGNWRGQDIFSMFLPDISFTKENKSYDMDPVDHNKVIIENGVFKQGILDKTIIGKTLIHMIFDSFGPEAVRNFLDNNQRMLNRWLSEHCFTLGMGDCIPTVDDNKKIKEFIETRIQNVNTIIKEANVGIYNPDLDAKFIHISLEQDIKEQLDGAKYDFEKYMKKTIDRKNGMYITNSSGAKGDVLSAICQTRGFLGQTSIIDRRVAFGYDKRTLPHFSKDDYGAISRGFIVNNFFNGLDPHEVFFHQMGGRVGVIDTAIKTAESGYMQRRLIKALEDLSVKYGGTVRNGVNNIVQFAYGDDGIDPCKLNKQELKLIEYSNDEMTKKYLITEESMTLLKNIMTADSYKEMTTQKDYINHLRADYELVMEIRDTARKSYFKNMSVMNAVVFSPVFFPRTIKNARDMFKNQLSKKSDLTPTYIRTQLNELETELSRYLPKFSLNIFRALLYSNLSTKVSMIENKFNKVVFKFVIDTIREKYITSFVQPGEMVGIIGAQSMGEPLTQMSVPAETRIVVELNGRMMNTTIGEFVDNIIKNKNGHIFLDNTGHHTIMEVRDKMRILSVSPDEKIAWREISKVSRHPVGGQMMVVKTRTGRSTKATLSHSFLKRTINGIIPIEGSKLAVGDRIPVCMNLPAVDNAIEALSISGMKIEFNKLFGIFCAVSSYNFRPTKQGYVVNLYGNDVDRHMIYFLEKNGIAYEKRESIMIVKSVEMAVFINETFVKNFSCIYQMPLEFIRGYLEGIIHFYGVVQMSRKHVVIMMECARLVDIQNLLNYFGVFCHFGEGELVIVRKYIPKFAKEFEILGYEKREQIKFILDTQRDTRECIDYVDKIPALGNLIADIGKRLNLSGNSRVYGRWKESESIGRNTLKKYLNDFHGAMGRVDDYELKLKVGLIEQAVNSDVIWDEIVSIDYYDGDELEYVYDFTVPNAESFMVDNGIMVHNTLNTFHNAGVGAKALVTSTGVPRIKEIINVAKTIKSPSMEIYLKDEYAGDISGAKYVCNYIGFTKLQDIVERTMIIYENRNDETSIEEDVEYIRTYQEFADAIGIPVCPTDQTSNWILRVVFNKEKMMNKNIYLSDIQDVIQRNSVEDDIVCIFSDDNAKELMMRIRIREDSHDGDYLEFLQELEKILMGITIRGIPNIEQVQPIMRKKIVYRDDGSYNQTTEWYLQTIGVNLLDVLMNDKIDSNRSLSNDIHEINEIFGIEATRAIIIRELMKMQDYEVNYRHLSLLGDIMTHRGIIMPIERHGINRSGERGAIAKATFEESTEILVKASTFAEKDKMGGVSANVMFGQLPRVGTNSFDILFDEVKFFNELKKMKTEGKKYEEKVDILDKIEEKLLKEYDENLGDTVDNMFNFSVDATKLTEKPMKPHIIPETGLNNVPVADSKKKKIQMKKKE